MKLLHVKPAGDLVVLDPRTRAPLPPMGRQVEDIPYWRRRLADGDIVIVPDGAPADAPADAQPEGLPAPRKSKKGASS